MEPIQKVRQISQKEAREIDANNVDFFTLTDGTIVRIKGEGEASYGSGAQIKEGQPILSQINKISGEEGINSKEIKASIEESNQMKQIEHNILTRQYKQKVQVQNQQVSNIREEENNFQVKTSLTSGNEALGQNTDEILQPGDNYGYYISNNGGNIIQTQKIQRCTCNHQLPQGAFLYNAHLIDAEIIENQLVNELELKNLSQSETQIFQQGPTKRKKLFKLIEAVPIVITDIGKQSMNQNTTDTQINFQQSNSNTYAVEKYRLQNMKQKMGMNYKTQFYQQNYGRIIPRSKTYLNNQRLVKKRNQYAKYGNKLRNIKNQKKIIQGTRNWQYNNRFDNEQFQCTCPIGSLKMAKLYNMTGNDYYY